MSWLRWSVLWLVGGLCVACGAAPPKPKSYEGSVAPVDDVERQILGRLAELEADSPTEIGGLRVVAGAPYPAASCRTCRGVTLTRGASEPARRLACTEGEAWFFVPNVFVVPVDEVRPSSSDAPAEPAAARPSPSAPVSAESEASEP